MWIRTCVFLALSTVGLGNDDDLRFKPFNSEPGIYYAEIGKAWVSTSDWKFIAYYNLTSYWIEWEHLQQTRMELETTCQGVNITLYVRRCGELLQPITYLMENIDDRNPILRTTRSRRRRAPLDFVGNLMGDLFGVLDQRDAQQYHDQIQKLAVGTLGLKQLVQQQTHVLDLTTSVLRKEEDMIKTHYDMLRKEVSGIVLHEEFLDALFQLSNAIFLFKDTQSDLIDMLSDVHHGRASLRILPPKQLEEQLRVLRNLIPVTTSIPDSRDSFAQIYRLLGTKAGIVGKQLIFEVRLPLLEQEEYQVFNVIPVPTQQDGRFIYIEPEARYLLVHQHRTWYYPLLEEALKSCRPWTGNSRVCALQGPLYNLQTPSIPCEAALLTHTEDAIKRCQIRSTVPTTYLHYLQSNQWIMVLPKETIFDLQCQASPQPVRLAGSGILALAPGCTLRGSNVRITGRLDYITTSNHIAFMPAFNLSSEVKPREVVVASGEIDKEITGLQQTVRDLQHQESGVEVDFHHISHYSMSAAMFSVILVLVVVSCKYRKSKSPRGQERRQQPRSTTNRGSPGNLI